MDALHSAKRRQFLKQTMYLVGFGAVASTPVKVFAKSAPKKLTILHTNDWHSRIEPFPAIDKQFGGMGGAAYRAALIKRIRKEEENVLLLDAGDIFQGTPYFNFYGGELEYKLMSEMGYDCVTIGNHDFDNGLDGLIRQLPHANFDIVNANYDFSKTPLASHVKPYKIIEKGGIRIGIFGLGIELKGLVPDKLYGNTVYQDPIEWANKIVPVLKNKKHCDLVICLSHLGYKYRDNKVSDEVLATQTSNIDLIIGGHTHTFLPEPVPYKNKEGKTVLVNQVGWAGLNVGKIDYWFEPFVKAKVQTSTSLLTVDNIQDS